MRDSASQGALTKAVGEQQGLITEAGYTEQAQSYQTMSQAAHVAADAENQAANAAGVTGILKAAAAVASVFTGGTEAPAIVGQAANSANGDPTGIGGLY